MIPPERVETEVRLLVPAGYVGGGRLDRYITGFVPNATRSKVQKAIRDGQVSVNGRVETKVSHTVVGGDEIVCVVWRPPPIRIEPEAIPLDIVHEDADVIVIDKAAGMVVHPAYGHRSGTLVNALLHHLGSPAIEAEADDDVDEEVDPAIRPGIVHRLDKDTSGLLVVARNELAHVKLARQFEDRTIHRTYAALVWGNPPSEGVVDAPIGRSPRDRKLMAVVRKGKAARTHYRVLTRFAHAAMLELRLETGRTHQIRVHMASIGHHVLGDRAYGGDAIRSGPDTRVRRAFYRNLFEELPRQALHARRLEFVHPTSGENVAFESELPADFSRAIARLERDE